MYVCNGYTMIWKHTNYYKCKNQRIKINIYLPSQYIENIRYKDNGRMLILEYWLRFDFLIFATQFQNS